jgi:type I restriction enzyme S subunit
MSVLKKMKEVNAEIEEFNNEVHCQEQLISKLRQSILQEAVQGKLVPQDPNDEPASVLLERIKEEKERLIKEGKIKKEKPLPPISEDEIPYELPEGWEWVRLGEVTNYAYNETLKPDEIDEEEWVLELEDIEKDTSRLIQVIRNKDRKSKSNKNRFYKGDVLYGKLRPYLKKVLVAPEDGVCSTEIIPFRGYGNIESRYIMYIMKSPYIDKIVNSITHGMNMPRLGTKNALELLIPLPPINEQKRIVEKVDQLMALCDELEKNIEQSKKDCELLIQSVLQEAFKEA